MLLLVDPRRGQIVDWNGGNCHNVRCGSGIAIAPHFALACFPRGVGLLPSVAEGLSWLLQQQDVPQGIVPSLLAVNSGEQHMTRRHAMIAIGSKRAVNRAVVPVISALLALVAGYPLQAMAQAFPVKPIRVIVPFAAGGNLDIVMRSLGQKLNEQMGQQIIIDNRIGASGSLGTDIVAKAAPDGYTLLSTSNTFVATPAVVKTTTYDPVRDFAGISVFAWIPQILVVNPAVPANSVTELIALAKRRPGELTYGSAGNGGVGHITAELFSSLAGIKMIHVPYKGNAPALTDVVGGQINFMFDTISTSIQYVKTGKLKALGVTSTKPSPIFPQLPAIGESALPGYEAIVFNAMLAPAGTPRAILNRLHAEISKAVQQADLRNRFIEQGVELTSSASPDECSAFIRQETAKYAKIIREAGIRGD